MLFSLIMLLPNSSKATPL